MTIATFDTGQGLSLLGQYDPATASSTALFSGDGTRVSAIRRSPTYERDFDEVSALYESVLAGNRYAAVRFSEAMARADFSYLFGDVIDRQMLAIYQTAPVQWNMVARRGRVRDFREVKRFTLDGGNDRLSQVAELAPYPTRAVSDGKYSYQVKKYGGEIPISWETLVNDDLDALQDLPERLALGARRTEEYFATALYATSSGPDATFFSDAHKNKINATVGGTGVPTNPALSIQGMQYAMQVMAQQVDSTGNPIYIQGVTLVVPPALKVIAMNIINATQIMAGAGGGDGTGNDQLLVNNWMRNDVRVMVNPWLPIIDTTHGNSAWYVFADPSVGRPAAEVGFLTGHEVPELRIKSADSVRVGGGAIGPEEGDFEHDAVRYRVRYVLGGTNMDHKSGVASTGAGS